MSTWQPAPGTVDAARNCLSNIPSAGVARSKRPPSAWWHCLLTARRHRMTGVALGKLLATEPSRLLPEQG